MSRYYVSNVTTTTVTILDTVDLVHDKVSMKDFVSFRRNKDNMLKLINCRSEHSVDNSIEAMTIDLKNGYIYFQDGVLEVVCGSNKMKIFWLNRGHLGVETNEGIFLVYNQSVDNDNPYHYTVFTGLSSILPKSILVKNDCLCLYFRWFNYAVSINYRTSKITLQGAYFVSLEDFIQRCIETNEYHILKPLNFLTSEFFNSNIDRNIVRKVLEEYWLKNKVILQRQEDVDSIRRLMVRYSLRDYDGQLGRALFLAG